MKRVQQSLKAMPEILSARSADRVLNKTASRVCVNHRISEQIKESRSFLTTLFPMSLNELAKVGSIEEVSQHYLQPSETAKHATDRLQKN
jgi:hypothetical protein